MRLLTTEHRASEGWSAGPSGPDLRAKRPVPGLLESPWHLMAFLLPFPLRVFGNDERAAAIAWLSSIPEGPGVSHRLLPESGVLVAEVTAGCERGISRP
jgi:hypothetical protein